MASSLNADLTDHKIYIPNRGDVLLSRVRHTIYSTSSERLFAVSETYLTEFEWAEVFSFSNHTSADVKKTLTISRGLIATSGSEVSKEFGLSANFKGIGINMGSSSTHFQSVETSEVTTTTTEITCLANATTRYYQRVYRFRTHVWYILDAWAELSRVGGLPRWSGDKNYTPTYSEARHEIEAQNFFLTHVALTGQGTFSASATSPPLSVPFKWTRQFNNTTKRCQDHLKGLANRGMAFISGYNATRSANKNEGEGAEHVGEGHPPDESQDEIVSITKRTSDAPPDY